jgi:exosortase A-associated hydrolase 1
VSTETPVRFACADCLLAGIVHTPDRPASLGVVVVVGGPQYRVGSHRQFVLLARSLASAGYPVLRFDCRGMGDSDGEFPGFENISADVEAAISALVHNVPQVRSVVLWGLCDAASAALIYAHGDARVAGLVLLNPWVRSQATLARAYLRRYYVARFLSGDFWRKTLSGRLAPQRVLADLLTNLRAGTRRADADDRPDFISRMREGLRAFSGPILIFLSGNDITAAEFARLAASEPWASLLARPGIERHPVPDANHTFATAAWRDEVAARTLNWLHAAAARVAPGMAADERG